MQRNEVNVSHWLIEWLIDWYSFSIYFIDWSLKVAEHQFQERLFIPCILAEIAVSRLFSIKQ